MKLSLHGLKAVFVFNSRMARFTPESIMGMLWEEFWITNDLGNKEPEDIQKEYVKFCRHYKITAPCWKRIEPYPVPNNLNVKLE